VISQGEGGGQGDHLQTKHLRTGSHVSRRRLMGVKGRCLMNPDK